MSVLIFSTNLQVDYGSVVVWSGSLEGSFWIMVVFPLVINSGTCVPCRHLFISSASLSWMEMNFLNQNPCILSWSNIFQFDIYFSVIWRKSMCIATFGPSSNPSNSFFISLIHWNLLLCFLSCYILVQIVRFLMHSFVGMFSYNLLLVVDRIFFRCFGMSCLFVFFCIVLRFVDIFLIFLLLLVFSGLFPQVVLLFFLVLPLPFCLYMFQRLFFVLSFWPVFVNFFICISGRISHPGFNFIFVLFERIPIFSQTNFPLA